MLTVDTIPLLKRDDRCQAPGDLFEPTPGTCDLAPLLRFLMTNMLTAATTELFELETFRGGLLVLGSHVVATLALCALQNNIVTRHKFKSPISNLQFEI